MRGFKKELTMLGVMIALAIITAVLNPVFFGGDNLRNNIRHISLISLFALVEAIVIIAGGIDLSIGSVICITGVSTSYLAMYGGFGIGAAVAIAFGIALVIGVVQGGIIARLGIPPFVVTLGFMLLLRGIAEVLTGGTDVGFQGKYEGFRARGKGEVRGVRRPGQVRGAGRAHAVLVRGGLDRARLVHHAPHAVRALLLRDRIERGGGAPLGRAGHGDPAGDVPGRGAAVGRGGHAVRRVPAHRDALDGFLVRAARGRGGGAGRLLAAGRE